MANAINIIDAIRTRSSLAPAPIQKARDLDGLAGGAESHLRSGDDRR